MKKGFDKNALIPELVIIGMHNAYMGYQFLEGSDVVESFYADEEQHQEEYKKWLLKAYPGMFLKERGLKLRSKVIVDALTSSKYFKDKTYIGQETLEGHRFFTLRPLNVLDLSELERISMLYGIFLRYGKLVDNDSIRFEFANSQDKVEFIELLLYRSPLVKSVTVQRKATIPTLTTVWINDATELCILFEQYVYNLKGEYQEGISPVEGSSYTSLQEKVSQIACMEEYVKIISENLSKVLKYATTYNVDLNKVDEDFLVQLTCRRSYIEFCIEVGKTRFFISKDAIGRIEYLSEDDVVHCFNISEDRKFSVPLHLFNYNPEFNY